MSVWLKTGLGYEKLNGELSKLGYEVGVATVRDVLHRHHLLPAPERKSRRTNWRTFLKHYQPQKLACGFFTIESVFLITIYVLFFIELNTRHVYVAGCTNQPNATWVAQQARQFLWQFQDEQRAMRFLIRDRDSKFSASFDTVFSAEGIETLLTSYRAPNANTVAERWVRSVRTECLDRVLKEYTDYYSTALLRMKLDFAYTTWSNPL